MIYVLRFLHIIGGVFWVGSAMFGAFLLMPSLRAAGPAAGPVMNQLAQVRKLPMVMTIAALVTMGAGIWLMLLVSAGSPGVWMRSGPGRTFGLGAAFAILGFLIGMTVSTPTARRLGVIGAVAAKRGSPPTTDETAEMQRLQRRMSVVSQVVTLLLILAAGAMAVARYVR